MSVERETLLDGYCDHCAFHHKPTEQCLRQVPAGACWCPAGTLWITEEINGDL